MAYLNILLRAGGPLPGVLFGSILQFGDFELDCGRFELRRKGQALRLERKPMELLILLASREGQLVTRTEIAACLWSSEVFVDTEHGINTAVRKLRYLLRDDPDHPRFIQTVTGMGYKFIALISTIEAQTSVTAPAAAIGSVPDDRTEGSEGGTATFSVKSHLFWTVLCASAVILIATLAFTLGPHPLAARIFHRSQPAITSVAVLPLDNLSGDPNQEYFADGMTEELITMLAKDSTLRITSRTSVMQYKGAHKLLPEIARALNVDAILEGSVSRSTDQVHMTLQLIRGDTDSHLWADSYDRNKNDAAQLPDQAARQVATYLHKATSIAASVRFVNPDAHDAYLRGKYIWYTGSNEEAGKYFRKATELQPDYAQGWSGLAGYYGAGLIEGNSLPPALTLAALDSDRSCL